MRHRVKRFARDMLELALLCVGIGAMAGLVAGTFAVVNRWVVG